MSSQDGALYVIGDYLTTAEDAAMFGPGSPYATFKTAIGV
jgi:hypothetical protein